MKGTHKEEVIMKTVWLLEYFASAEKQTLELLLTTLLMKWTDKKKVKVKRIIVEYDNEGDIENIEVVV